MCLQSCTIRVEKSILNKFFPITISCYLYFIYFETCFIFLLFHDDNQSENWILTRNLLLEQIYLYLLFSLWLGEKLYLGYRIFASWGCWGNSCEVWEIYKLFMEAIEVEKQFLFYYIKIKMKKESFYCAISHFFKEKWAGGNKF